MARERLNNLFGKWNKRQSKSLMVKVMTSEVTINLNMFGHFMKDEVVNNLNSTFIITIHLSGEERKPTIMIMNN